jgi:HD superfamily phosphohydrolase
MNHILQREEIQDEDQKLLLLWAILLHDIGKAPTFSRGEDGEAHYYDHEHIGAEMFLSDIAPRLKFSNTFQEKIYFLIQEHLRLFKIPQMRKLKARTLMMHPYFPLLLKLGEADNRGRIPAKEEVFQEIQKMYNDFKKLLKNKKFLRGNDIMERYPELC